MTNKITEIVARGLCSFAVGLDRDLDGSSHVISMPPRKPCESLCEFCLVEAVHLVEYLKEEGINVHE
jgi:hypothetical protein